MRLPFNMQMASKVLVPYSRYDNMWEAVVVVVYLISFVLEPFTLGMVAKPLYHKPTNWLMRTCSFLLIVDFIVLFFKAQKKEPLVFVEDESEDELVIKSESPRKTSGKDAKQASLRRSSTLKQQ